MKNHSHEKLIALKLGENIRRARGLQGLSQAALAEFCEIHPTYLGLIERGSRLPSLIVVFRLASALDSHAHQLLKFGSRPKAHFPKIVRCRHPVGEEPLCNVLQRLVNSRRLRKKLAASGVLSKTRK